MIQRHSLVWLRSTSPWDSAEAVAWFAAGRPFIVCRTRPGESLSLGFCQPGSGSEKPRRFAVAAHEDQIAKVERPPVWQHSPDDARFTIRLIGSRMWEQWTGELYHREGSDIDLVVDLDSAASANTAIAWLTDAAKKSSVGIDAELSFPGLGEVHWKEWASASPEVLVKSIHVTRLIPRTDLP